LSNLGNPYVFAPEYAKNFPPLKNWVLLRDYDGDGIKDIFSCGNYTNVSLHFEKHLVIKQDTKNNIEKKLTFNCLKNLMVSQK
jgi:hypothetical protein